jgi:hypothetical protein
MLIVYSGEKQEKEKKCFRNNLLTSSCHEFHVKNLNRDPVMLQRLTQLTQQLSTKPGLQSRMLCSLRVNVMINLKLFQKIFL